MHDESTIDDHDALLARIAIELDGATDPNEVIERYCREHPDAATRIRGFRHTHRALQKIGADSASLVGMKLGSFTLTKRLGEGMSIVYVAKEDPPLKRTVAVKLMRPDRPATRKDIERFELEQELLARLNQPHIVPILQTGFASGLQYFVMPLIEGASLGHVAQAVVFVDWVPQ